MTPDGTDDGVLEPEDLNLEETDEHVARLDENRYVVRSDDSRSGAGTHTDALPADAAQAPPITGADADPSAEGLEAAPEPHGVDIALKTDGEIAHHRATSHDVREVFVDLLTWYASQLDDDMSPSEALQVMLAASDLEV